MQFGIEQRVFSPVQRGYEMMAHVARQAIHNAGRSGALDGLVRADRNAGLSTIEYDLDNLLVRPRKAMDDEAIAEVEVLKHYMEVHGPKNATELAALDETAEPDPLAVKQIVSWLDEKLPDPDPDPHSQHQANL